MTTPPPVTGWAGRALLQPGTLVYAGLIGPTGRHAHHAVQVMLTAAPVDVDDGAHLHRGTRLIIPADTAHRIITATSHATIVFLDPATAPGRCAHRAGTAAWHQPHLLPGPVSEDLTAVAHAVAAAVRTTTDDAPLVTPGVDPVAARHPAVVEALHLLTQLAPGGAVRTRDVAARIGISTTRLTHVFTAATGLPLRRYVLWLRLMMAFRAVADGDDLTAAAHAAGFADSAHLTRTCQAMFGLSPSILQRHVTLTVVPG
ncbi:hypothetical protein BEL07_24250 [Mycolicibacterium grossiae]|uniref:HTH araC/xylS-type domain-containing protein n=1 Tax=Mycolicibacterium grossiae TaxID=1552759 RepID=A0A1E8PZH0_9MYCO|nr:helix-turn-helix domain-containing protein [Mycolicibacterium grossiae]OFJ51179.1 hypothetical protein BEL07_24250 [Mycolicibacterium grossiae]